MTDNEIIKAFEVFVNRIGKGMIFAKLDVKIDETNEFKHIDLSFDDIFALINRQKEEVERLKNHIQDGIDLAKQIPEMLALTKAEAYKEFEEKANEIIDLLVDLMFDGSISKCQLPNCHLPSSIPCENEICIQQNKDYWHIKLDNLLKEMVGED